MEWLAFVTGVICVYLCVKERDSNWPVGVVNSFALLYVFWVAKLYAQAGLQLFYIFECFYGWWMWTRHDQSTGLRVIRIGRTNVQTRIIFSAIGIGGTVAMTFLFAKTGDPAPLGDSVITVASLIAEYMLCLKLLEAWGVYFASDVIALILLAYLRQWVTFGTYLCFTFLCIMGILEWLKRLRRNFDPGLSLANSIP
jgi:nicotinamide mononucleotide transporter